jgi:hypothetical protein
MSATTFLDSQIIAYTQFANSPTIMVTSAVDAAPRKTTSVRYQLPKMLETIDESVAWSLHDEEEASSYDEEDSSFWGCNFDPATLMVDERYVQESHVVFPDPEVSTGHPGDLTLALERYDSIAAAEEFNALTADLSFTLGLYGYLVSRDSCNSLEGYSCSFTSKDISALLASGSCSSFVDTSLVVSESGYDASVSNISEYDDEDEDDTSTITPASPILVPSLIIPSPASLPGISEYACPPIIRSSPAPITPTTLSVSGIITPPTTPTSFSPEIRAEVAETQKKEKKNVLITFLKSFCSRGILSRTNHGKK